MNGNERNGKELRYCYRYPHPSVTTDCVIFGFDGRRLHVLLVQRGADPYKGRWAFPGGFLNMDESAEEGALRELQEETGLRRPASASSMPSPPRGATPASGSSPSPFMPSCGCRR